ncbi:MAG: LysR family transcriptional regulator [Pseudomonadota bacterium]
MTALDWEALKTFAIVCRAGTMSAAARELGINQTTVARRIARLEEMLGHPVLRRDGVILQATPRARGLLQTADAMAAQLAESLKHSGGALRSATVSGVVRVTGVDALLESRVAPALGRLIRQHPDLCVDLIGGNRNLSLPQREADIALRLARPDSGAFHIRRLGDMAYGVYCAAPVMDPMAANWIDLDDEFADKPEQVWLNRHYPNRKTVGRGNRGGVMAQMAVAANACLLIPRCVGDGVPGLRRVDIEPVSRELWLLTHQDMAHLPRVRVVADWLVSVLCDGVFVIRSR